MGRLRGNGCRFGDAVRIRGTRRDVGPCRVPLVSLTDWSIFRLFLTDDEQFANWQLWKNLLWACREKLSEGEIEG